MQRLVRVKRHRIGVPDSPQCLAAALCQSKEPAEAGVHVQPEPGGAATQVNQRAQIVDGTGVRFTAHRHHDTRETPVGGAPVFHFNTESVEIQCAGAIATDPDNSLPCHSQQPQAFRDTVMRVIGDKEKDRLRRNSRALCGCLPRNVQRQRVGHASSAGKNSAIAVRPV